MASETRPTSTIRSANDCGSRAWGPSERACSGLACTSTISPSAPAATPARYRCDELGSSRRMARVDNHRKRGQLLEDGHCVDVERVSSGRLKGPDAAFTDGNILVSPRKNVFGGLQQLVERRARASLQQDRPPLVSDRLQKAEVGHVAGPDLKHVGVLGDKGNIGRRDYLRDNGHLQIVGDPAQHHQAFFAEPLEAVGRGARLERPTSQHLYSGFGDRDSGCVQLFLALDRTRSRHHQQSPSAQARSVGKGDHPIFWLEVSACQLERVQDANDPLDAAQDLEQLGVDRPFVSDDSDNGSLDPFGEVRAEAEELTRSSTPVNCSSVACDCITMIICSS